MMRTIKTVHFIAMSLAIACCSNNHQNNYSFSYQKLGEKLFLKTNNNTGLCEIIDSYDGDDYTNKTSEELGAMDFLVQHMTEQYNKKSCDDIFYCFVPYGSSSSAYKNEKSFIYAYDEAITIDGEEIYTNPVAYYSFYLSDSEDNTAAQFNEEIYHIYGVFFPIKESNNSVSISIKNYSKTTKNVTTMIDNRVVSSIFYHKDLVEDDLMKNIMKYYSFFTDFDDDRNSYEGMRSQKEYKEMISSDNLTNSISEKMDGHYLYINTKGSNNRLFYDVGIDGKIVSPVLYQFRIVSPQVFLGDGSIEKMRILINSKPSIHSVNAYFFISKNSINSIRYTYSKMYGLLNKICVYSEDSLVGVVYMTASVQLMEFELLTDYLNDVLRIV